MNLTDLQSLTTYGLLFLGLAILLWLAYRDIKTLLLPNVGVLAFAVTGIAYRGVNAHDMPLQTALDSLYGLLAAGAFLLLLRALFNKRHNRETLGLGDVKLMMAGGLWLGFPSIITAISIGAFLGIFWGIAAFLLTSDPDKSLAKTKFAAGPGFIGGLIVVICEHHFMLEFFP